MGQASRIATLVAALIVVSGSLLAFHDEGVAHCNGCHTMHNTQDGALIDPDSPSGNAWLLVDSTPSDTCLSCHASSLGAVLSGPGFDPLAPATERGGGNFVFLYEDNLNDGHAGASNPIPGDTAGHNLVAPGYSLAADATLTMAPGGTFPAGVMGCTSCHDPHGNTEFRLLYTTGQTVASAADYAYANPAPVAEGLALFGGGESQTNHTAYQSGMSAWCANCHGDFHNNNTMLVHPSGSPLGGSIAQTYNLYNGSTDQIGGLQPTAYLAEVPFEDVANTTGSTAGPSGTSQISCITCHRAHGTSAPDAGRWDFSVTFLHEDGVESGSYAIPDPYMDLNQRSLCNKCHNQDELDGTPF